MQWMMTCPEKISLTWKTQKLWKSKHRSTRVKTSIKHSEYIFDIHIVIIFIIYNGFSSSYINIQEWFTLIYFFRKGVAFIYLGRAEFLDKLDHDNTEMTSSFENSIGKSNIDPGEMSTSPLALHLLSYFYM